MDFPDPVIGIAVEPKTKADVDKLGIGLGKLAEEDPTFTVRSDEASGQTIISGMGELHLDVIVDRLKREFKVEVNQGQPQVEYKEAITASADHREVYKKQSGGRGKFADIVFTMEPADEGFQGLQFESTIKGGNVHAVDYDQLSFELAAKLGYKAAAKSAKEKIMEALMKLEVLTPEENMGDIVGDLNRRRGQVEGMDDKGGAKVVNAKVPLSEMFGYATDLRSRTQGRATFTMQFDSYEDVPDAITKEITASIRGVEVEV